MIRVGEEAPVVRRCEELVARPRVSDYLPARVDCIPVNRREEGVLAEVARVDLDWSPLLCFRRDAIRLDRPREMVSHRSAVREMDRLSSADRQERPEAEIGDTLHVTFRISARVLVEERIDSRWHSARVSHPLSICSRLPHQGVLER